VPNFIRGSLVLIIISFQFFKGHIGILQSALIVGFTCVIISLLALSQLKETFNKDLDYVEE
jgi:hypothetical protein